MKLPFTTEEFLKVFEKYNLLVWPVQYLFILMAIIAIFLGVKKTNYSARLIALILTVFWFWMGAVYHFSFFSAINKLAYVFGALFIVQGILFLYAGFLRNQFAFQFKYTIHGIAGAIIMLFALVIYPLIGYGLGRTYPLSPTFGVPCPTTIFTFGMLLWTDKKFPPHILIIPLLWSVIGFSAAIYLGIYEDTGLLIGAIIAVLLILINNKKTKRSIPAHAEHA